MPKDIITVKINPLLFLLIIIPLIFFIFQIYDILSYNNNSPIIQSTNSKNIIPTPTDPEIVKVFEDLEKVELAVQNHQNSVSFRLKIIIVLMYSIFIIRLFSLLVMMLFSKVQVDDEVLRVRILFKQIEIRIDHIKSIRVNRVTPLYKKNLSIKNITWREKVTINNQLVLSGLIFPKLSQVLTKIQQINPEVKVDYYINRIQDNVPNL